MADLPIIGFRQGFEPDTAMTTDELIHAIQSLNAEDAFRPRLDPQQWRTFTQYLTRHEIRSGELPAGGQTRCGGDGAASARLARRSSVCAM